MDTAKDQCTRLFGTLRTQHSPPLGHCQLSPPPPVVSVGLCRWPLEWWWAPHLCSRSESQKTPQSLPPPRFHWSLTLMMHSCFCEFFCVLWDDHFAWTFSDIQDTQTASLLYGFFYDAVVHLIVWSVFHKTANYKQRGVPLSAISNGHASVMFSHILYYIQDSGKYAVFSCFLQFVLRCPYN